MNQVAVVSDSAHYLPPAIVERLALHQVSIYVNWKNGITRETDMRDLGPFYDQMRSARELPTTSQPSVGDSLAAYEPLLERGHDIFSAHLSGGVSGTVQTARQARRQLVEGGIDGDRISVLDANTVCAGLCFVLMAASAAAGSGASLTETAQAARAVRANLSLWFAIETLEFLRRGGRIGAAQAWVGSALRIKPILTIESEVTPIERVRTSKRALERLLHYLTSAYDDGRDAWIVQHIQAPDQAQELVERGREIFGCEPEFVSEIGPSTGTHAGPGLLGAAAAPRRLLAPKTPITAVAANVS